MIPDGAILNYSGKWPPGNFFGFSDYTGKVFADLTAAGLAVRSQTTDATTATLLGTAINVNLQLQVQNGIGFDSPDDVISIVRHFVYQEAGAFPTADTIPTVQASPGQAPQSTGQPAPGGAKPTVHACGDPSWGFFDDPGQFITCLTQKGLSTLGLVLIGLMIGIAFILFAEHEA
jgi:hypothetical protein